MRFVPYDAEVSNLYVCLLYLSLVVAVYVVTTSLVFLFIYEPTFFFLETFVFFVVLSRKYASFGFTMFIRPPPAFSISRNPMFDIL